MTPWQSPRMDFFKSCLFMAACCAVFLFAMPAAHAQDNNTEATPSTTTEPVKETETKMEKTMWELVKAGGVVMWALTVLALYGFYSAGAQIYVIVFSNDIAKDEQFVDNLVAAGGSHAELLEAEIQKRNKGIFPRVCEAALAELQAGKAAMEDALATEGSIQLGMLKRSLNPLRIVVAVAPLLGLLGTVYGMISSFQSVEIAGAGGDKVELLSRGIYEALVTTATGLTVAIPFLLIYHWLGRRVDEIGVNLNRQSKRLLEQCTSGGQGGNIADTQGAQEPESPQPVQDSET